MEADGVGGTVCVQAMAFNQYWNSRANSKKFTIYSRALPGQPGPARTVTRPTSTSVRGVFESSLVLSS
eukprot:1055557-Rhodomonas_salina.2